MQNNEAYLNVSYGQLLQFLESVFDIPKLFDAAETEIACMLLHMDICILELQNLSCFYPLKVAIRSL